MNRIDAYRQLQAERDATTERLAAEAGEIRAAFRAELRDLIARYRPCEGASLLLDTVAYMSGLTEKPPPHILTVTRVTD